jgi:hypothetical protein
VLLRPTVPDDLPFVVGEPLPVRIQAITALVEGRVIGVGGIGYWPSGEIIAFVQALPEARDYPVAFHRAGLMAMRMIRDSGAWQVIATADAANPTNLRWLERLGFVRAPSQHIDGKVIFVWHKDRDVERSL